MHIASYLVAGSSCRNIILMTVFLLLSFSPTPTSATNEINTKVMSHWWQWTSRSSADNEELQIREIITGQRTCPTLKALKGQSSIPLCPSYQVREEDNSRIPSVIVQTRCKCSDCLVKRIKRKISLCKPVYKTVPVLRFTECRRGIKSYSPAWEKISVACVCELNNSRGNYSNSSKMLP